VAFFQSIFSFFLSWWGAFLIAALDASMLFFLPFGVAAVVIYMSARDEKLFWIYPILAAAGSTMGAGTTFWIGKKAGEVGLERYVPERRLERIRCRIRDSGAIAMAIPAMLPPPFPLTPFVLTCGALRMNPWRFFATFGTVRLLRFGGEAVLAVVYGRRILRVLQSDAFQMVVIGFIIVAIVGSVVSIVMLWRGSKRAQPA